MSRDDIQQADVFISWTGADKQIKDKIEIYLKDKGLKVLCSDDEEHPCVGDFVEWSEKAVPNAHVVVVLASKQVSESSIVNNEIQKSLFMSDANNRILSIVEDLNSSLYNKQFFNPNKLSEKKSLRIADESRDVSLSLKGKNNSAIICGDWLFNQPILEEIYKKVERLLVCRLVKIYKDNLKEKNYMDITPLLTETQRNNFNSDSIYVDERTLIQIEEDDTPEKEISSFEDILLNIDTVSYVYGEGGCGKTEFFKHLANRISKDDEHVPILLKCSDVASFLKESSTNCVLNSIYNKFKSMCGNIHCSFEDFKSIYKNHSFILIFDGIDEIVTTEATKKFIDALKGLYENNDTEAKRPKLVFTGRRLEERNDLAFFNDERQMKVETFELKKFNDDNIKKLIDNLFLKLSTEEKGKAFYLGIKTIDDELKSNPLLLTQLALIYDAGEEMPKTRVEIFDKLIEMILKNDTINKTIDDKISSGEIKYYLREFAIERYNSLSKGKDEKEERIFERILFKDGCEKSKIEDLSKKLVEYLENRAILIKNNFYHKLLLEYFTAVGYFERYIRDKNSLNELFIHYNDTKWADVFEMFFIKADSDKNFFEDDMTSMLKHILKNDITDYTLLFDSSSKLVNSKTLFQTVLIKDILIKSTTGVFPPYGPLFYYVPEYEVYESCILALDEKELKGNAKALALVRDVCFICRPYNSITEITDKVSGRTLFNNSVQDLKGIRKALCEIFYLGDTDYTGGDNIYPRCFNVLETKLLRDRGIGILGIMKEAFEDELNLFSHEQYNEVNGEYMGFISCPNDTKIETTLRVNGSRKITCIALTTTKKENATFDFYRFYRKYIRIYVDENDNISDTRKLEKFGKAVRINIFSGKIQYSWFWADLRDNARRSFKKSSAVYNEITSIEIPNIVINIGNYQFNGFKNVTSITIPTSVTSIGASAFYECSKLTNVYYEGTIGDWCNITFKSADANPMYYASHFYLRNSNNEWEEVTSIEVPNTVTEIGSYQFYGFSNVTSITIPTSVTSIGSSAFSDCRNLTSIVIPDSVTSIGNFAFEYCGKLTNIVIPNSVRIIGYTAFHECFNLTNVYYEGTIEDWCNIIFGNSYANPMSSHFYLRNSNNEWEEVTSIEIPNTVTSIGDWQFHFFENVTSITIPDSVTSIGNFAFANCSKLISIVIPASVERIGEGAFECCNGLVSVAIGNNVEIIEDYAFSSCINLFEVKLPSKVTWIGEASFYNCDLKEVDLSQAKLVEIDYRAFVFCGKLRKVKISRRFDKDIERKFGNIDRKFIEWVD